MPLRQHREADLQSLIAPSLVLTSRSAHCPLPTAYCLLAYVYPTGCAIVVISVSASCEVSIREC